MVYLLFNFFIFFTIFLVTALLRYNSDTIQFTHLKGTLQWLLVYSQSYATIISVNFRTFSSPWREILHQFALTPRSLLSPTQPLTYFLSIQSCLFWKCPISGVLYHVHLWHWLLSLHVMFSSFIHVVACWSFISLITRCHLFITE